MPARRPPDEEAPLALAIGQRGHDLCWSVTHVGDASVWVFVLVPSVIAGRLSFAVDCAWLELADDGTLLVRKVDAALPDDVLADDRVRSGAVLLAPGASVSGAIALAAPLRLRVPYRARRDVVTPSAVVLEVGWVPERAGQAVEHLEHDGRPFGYLYPEDEPGGQRYARSARLAWAA
jgi:hypothetical protein